MISERVTGLELTKHWTFSYLGSNQDLKTVSMNTGINLGNMMSYTSTTNAGTASGWGTTIAATSGYMNERVTSGASNSSTFYNVGDVTATVDETGKVTIKDNK